MTKDEIRDRLSRIYFGRAMPGAVRDDIVGLEHDIALSMPHDAEPPKLAGAKLPDVYLKKELVG